MHLSLNNIVKWNITTNIQNISDFLLWVKETSKTEVMSDEGKPLEFENDYGYYRGQSCACWDLKPSVLREPPFLDENSLLKKATLRLWNEISSLNTYLEKMIFFQHYGLSTRLLDVTFNPLVALYMACCEEDKQGRDVFLADSGYMLQVAQQDFPKIKFHFSSEF